MAFVAAKPDNLINKREAEADAESDVQLPYTNAAYTKPYTNANPYVYNIPYSKYHFILKYLLWSVVFQLLFLLFAATYYVPKTSTYSAPYMTNAFPYLRLGAKREAEGEANADAQYYYGNYYGAYPYTTYGYPYTYGAYPYNTYGYRYLY